MIKLNLDLFIIPLVNTSHNLERDHRLSWLEENKVELVKYGATLKDSWNYSHLNQLFETKLNEVLDQIDIEIAKIVHK